MKRKNDDINYLATNLGMLTGVPVRIYKNREIVFTYSLFDMIKDPVSLLSEDDLITKNQKIGYLQTKHFYYYGYLNHKDITLLVGPFRLIKPDDITLREIAFELELTNDEDIESFVNTFKSIPPMPLETILQSLCMFNFYLTGEKKILKDIIIDELKTNNFDENIQTASTDFKDGIIDDYGNNTANIENELFRMVEHGDVDELKLWMENAPTTRPGVLSKDSLRQIKNTFIVSTTLASRAAIRGHMDTSDAMALSDLYIQTCESMMNIQDVMVLQMNMILDYTSKVAKIRGKRDGSSFLISLNKYIISHLSDAIKVEDICDSLYISKSTLFDKLKKETGMTVSEYILKTKINESKSLLKYTNRSLSSISAYLGFSSQSHFNHTFKKFVEKTPSEYRESHK